MTPTAPARLAPRPATTHVAPAAIDGPTSTARTDAASVESPSPLPLVSLSVIIAALNEEATLAPVVHAVVRTQLAHEVIIVDDGSTDGTPRVIQQLHGSYPGLVRSLRHPARRGKGASIQSALPLATGDVVLIQDADLEYNPADYAALLAPFAEESVAAVYGSRNLRAGNPRSSLAFYWGGRLLSWITNALFNSQLTDESTGYKLVRTSLLRDLALRADGFDFCPELTAKLLRRGVAIHEVPITYRPRTVAEGKKIRWRDGLVAMRVLIQQRFFARD